MDVSPKTLREVEFREKMRGYHPEDVDQFLERVAAGIEVLQDRLRQALERAQKAEAQVAEAAGTDDTLRRTLVLAQRTADLAIQEAREQAARILSGAEQQAQAMIGEAEEGVRKAHEQTLVGVQAELTKLESARQQLKLEVDALSGWVDQHRTHLAGALRSALASIETADLLSAPPAGGGGGPRPAAGTDAPTEAPDSSGQARSGTSDVDPSAGAIAGPGAAAGGQPGGATSPAAQRAGSEHPGAEPGPASGGPASGPAPGGPAAQSGAPGGTDPGIDIRTSAATARGHGSDGPDTMAWHPDQDSDQVPVAAAQDGDPYFAQLRQAVNAREPLGPRQLEPDDEPGASSVPAAESGEAFFDQDLADSQRHGGKLRRRR